ncbi:hypothetical protein [Alicyclobacillus sendaiensis]|uniref:hypothetical protein n=1 Tax=Alicyclobacillus sendaiensis TaxID=192387 RepID=UPI0026F4478A|nr:hypothetical protein [Alicyclobacillus sendaiensis]
MNVDAPAGSPRAEGNRRGAAPRGVREPPWARAARRPDRSRVRLLASRLFEADGAVLRAKCIM